MITNNTPAGSPAYGSGVPAADRRLPWNVMGKRLDGMDYASTADALADNGLNYQVEMWNLAGVHPQTGATLPAANLRTVVRPMPDGSHKVLAASGVRYTPIQNDVAFAVADDLKADHGAKIVGAADFRSGGASLMVVDLTAPVTLVTPDGTEDRTDLFLAIKNAHDGSAALTFAFTPVRIACTNALPAAISGAVRAWKINHTPNAQERVDLAAKAIRDAVAYRDAFTVAAQAMMDQAMSDREFDAIVARMFPVAEGREATKAGQNALEVRAQMTSLYGQSETLEGIRGTLWGGYNAITEWYDWARPVRQAGEDVARAEGALEGPYTRRKANVWDTFLQAV